MLTFKPKTYKPTQSIFVPTNTTDKTVVKKFTDVMKTTLLKSVTKEYLTSGVVVLDLPVGEAALHFDTVAMMLQAGGQVADHLILALNRLLVCC